MTTQLNTKLVHDLLKRLPEYKDFIQDKNRILDGFIKDGSYPSSLKDIEYDLFVCVNNFEVFKHFDAFNIDYELLLSMIN